MAITLPNGALVNIANGYGSAIAVTGISNASEAVFTAANTFATGDYVEVTGTGWSRLNDKVVRVKSATSTTFVAEAYDTSSTSIYPAGGGNVGSVRKVTGFTQLSQILTTTSSGGDQQFLTYQLLEADAQKNIPTFKTPSVITLEVADDPSLAGYILAKAANDDRLPRAIQIALPNGAKLLYNSYVSLSPAPSLTVNTIMSVQVTFSNKNEPVRYAS
jgi:hypothetical protein